MINHQILKEQLKDWMIKNVPDFIRWQIEVIIETPAFKIAIEPFAPDINTIIAPPIATFDLCYNHRNLVVDSSTFRSLRAWLGEYRVPLLEA